DLDLVGRDETATALQHAHLALPGHAGKAFRQLADDVVLVATQRIEIDLRLAEGDAEGAGVRGLVDDVGRVQQRLGRDAADVEAHAAQVRVTLDQHRIEAKVGGAEGGGVAAGARAEHHEAAFDVRLAAACG